MMADIRMLQEQTQQLQNLIGTLGKAMSEALDASVKNVNARLDAKLEEQNAEPQVVRRSEARHRQHHPRCRRAAREGRREQRPGRIADAGSRRAAQAGHPAERRSARRPIDPAPRSARRRHARSGVAPAAAAVGVSPQGCLGSGAQRLHRQPVDLAISGLRGVHQDLPGNPSGRRRAALRLQLVHNLPNNAKAIETCDLVIRNYPRAASCPDAYYRKARRSRT